ncbi:MAG: hypothetical protein KKA73_28470 [Chloroflexi bacterium]|nr:hypothetical protein [Chloroflexota bacterium]MBU1751629.1 hypothetical protein [Chloroflexota bacterium]
MGIGRLVAGHQAMNVSAIGFVVVLAVAIVVSAIGCSYLFAQFMLARNKRSVPTHADSETPVRTGIWYSSCSTRSGCIVFIILASVWLLLLVLKSWFAIPFFILIMLLWLLFVYAILLDAKIAFRSRSMLGSFFGLGSPNMVSGQKALPLATLRVAVLVLFILLYFAVLLVWHTEIETLCTAIMSLVK